MRLVSYVKLRRKENKITQKELAVAAGVGLRFLRDMEQGKKTLRLDKVNQVLAIFGAEMLPHPRLKNE
ncbi:MAG: helix-turn-helix domain-containing protein [Candidatus Margulisiibacteriota bacterium]